LRKKRRTHKKFFVVSTNQPQKREPPPKGRRCGKMENAKAGNCKNPDIRFHVRGRGQGWGEGNRKFNERMEA